MMANKPKLKYNKLDPTKAEFRVLDIQPGPENAQLCCTLRTVSLSARSAYGAISYVWGDPSDTATIKVADCEFDVTVNLHDVLEVLRNPEQVKTVWADAICINQACPEERTQQVGIMGSIYQRATQVHIWFGYFPEDWKAAIPDDDEYRLFRAYCDDTYPKSAEFYLARYHHKRHGDGVGPGRAIYSQMVLENDPLQNAITIMTLFASGMDIFELPFYVVDEIVNLSAGDDDECEEDSGPGERKDEDRDIDKDVLRAKCRVRPSATWYAAIAALLWLVERPWWTRCWTLQEAVVPECEPIVHAGRNTFLLKTVLNFAREHSVALLSGQDWYMTALWWCFAPAQKFMDNIFHVWN